MQASADWLMLPDHPIQQHHAGCFSILPDLSPIPRNWVNLVNFKTIFRFPQTALMFKHPAKICKHHK